MKGKILIIDDSRYVRNLISSTLVSNGFEVAQAENGLLAIEETKKQIFDLILCDIEMPYLDGLGVLKLVRQNPKTATIPFIFITARSERSDLRRGMEGGADDYITKPFTPEELIAAVETRFAKQEKIESVSETKLEKLRGNIVHALPHEMLTPLNGIIGSSEMLISYYDLMTKDEVLQTSKDILDSANRLHRLIQNFIVYAQVEVVIADRDRAKAMQGNETSKALDIIEKSAKKIAENHQREDDLKLDLIDATIQISEQDLEKIITELIDNAFKFSKKGTLVTITTIATKSSFHIEISDQGIGMKTEEIENIGAYMQFERKIREQQGFGFGLVLSKRLVELYGGELRIESEPKKSTTVFIKLKRKI